MTYPPQDPQQGQPEDPTQRIPQIPPQEPAQGLPPGSYPAPAAGQPYPAYPPPVAPTHRPTNTLAIASLVTSIVAFVLCSGLPGFIGAILGHIARKQIKETGEDGDGLALAGIIIGWVGTGLAIAGLAIATIILIVVANGNFDDSTFQFGQ